MRIIRLALLPGLLVAALLGPAEALANVDHFCGRVVEGPPERGCSNSPNRSHWDRVRARYPGHQAHNVVACVSMFNLSNNEIRSDRWYCDRTWSTPTWNPWGHNYGVTSASNYISQIGLQGGQLPHTLYGWTSDNQTDQ